MNHDKHTCDCGCMGAGPAITNLLNQLGSTDARNHFRAARVEFLKGLRALIDDRIEHLSRKQAESETAAGTTVPVE